MNIRVIVYEAEGFFLCDFEFPDDVPQCDIGGPVFRSYTMDHNDPAQRRVLGEQCRNAFEAGQCVLTYPVAA